MNYDYNYGNKYFNYYHHNGGELIELSKNFRSRKEVLDNINDLSKIYKNGKKEIDEHTLTKLLALIPKWDFMSDSEKMKFLDSHLSPAK